MEEQFSVRITWDVFVSSLHFGRRGCILADGWAALHRGDQRQGDRGSEHMETPLRSCLETTLPWRTREGVSSENHLFYVETNHKNFNRIRQRNTDGRSDLKHVSLAVSAIRIQYTNTQ